MYDIAPWYPPAPAGAPADLTTPPREYRYRVVLVLLSLLVFAAIYLALTLGSAAACVWFFSEIGADKRAAKQATGAYRFDPRTGRNVYVPPVTPPRTRQAIPEFWLIVGGISSGLICLFMVKGLFKRSRRDEGVREEVTEQDQPRLFAFIRKLCQETGAPFPHRVYLVPDVNAAVSFHESIVNLIFPSRKNLIIGLALVNRLNLCEFKAVLAHEFGHFSQNSMKLGSYVYTANRVVSDVVYGRDWLDDMIGWLGRIDLRIAIFAWGFMAILWVMRKGLELLFRGINFANVSLSRQMEYNADLVAVRATGSDALIFALARLDFAGESLMQAWNDLSAAADHDRYSRDLYFHHTQAAEFLKIRRNDPKLGEVPALPEDTTQSVQVFKVDDLSVPTMWATHPSNYDREVNAKKRYVRGPVDERSAWELFENLNDVREAVTRSVYSVTRKVSPGVLEEPEAVQEFIDAEHAETTYNPRYLGLYDNRYVKPGDLNELHLPSQRERFNDSSVLADAHAALYAVDLKDLMHAHKARGEEQDKLARLALGSAALTGSDFEHRGRRHQLTDAPKLLKNVEAELDGDYARMHAMDREMVLIHHAMAAQLGDADAAELEQWYRFHLAVQDIHATLKGHAQYVQNTLGALGNQRQVSQEDFQGALAAVHGAYDELYAQLNAANELRLPPLTNMEAGSNLGPFLLSKPILRRLNSDTNSIENTWVHKLLTQMGEASDKCARILFKSLGGLLALQERIADRWLDTHRTLDVVLLDESEEDVKKA